MELQLKRITIFVGLPNTGPSADYEWVTAWLERWKPSLRIESHSAGGWEHIWNLEGPEEAILEVPEHLLCASEWAGWTVTRFNHD